METLNDTDWDVSWDRVYRIAVARSTPAMRVKSFQVEWELVSSAPHSFSLAACLNLDPSAPPNAERVLWITGPRDQLVPGLVLCFPSVPRSPCRPTTPFRADHRIFSCSCSVPTDALMFSRASQLARHLSRPLPNLAHSSAAAFRGAMTTGPVAAATAADRASRKIHTAACLIIGDEVLGGKACYLFYARYIVSV